MPQANFGTFNSWSQNYQPVSCHRQNCLWNKHSPGRKTNPIKLLGTRQHIKLGSRQQAGNCVFFKFQAAGKKKQGNLYIDVFEKFDCSALHITKYSFSIKIIINNFVKYFAYFYHNI
jgi:hypothetical protein